MTLITEIGIAKKNVKTDSIQLSIGEMVSMYENDELNIQPEFQRLFRWGRDKKSDLFESILIGIPIPSIFAYENDDGTWELVDGLQRVSTLLEFMGVLKSPQDGSLLEPSALSGTAYLPSLQNAVWERTSRISGVPQQLQKPLEKAQQLFIRRGRLDVQVLKQPSDVETKFHLFQRLNRGGAYANEQEVRTCSMVMLNPEFVKKIRETVTAANFRKLTALHDEALSNQIDMEYAVRFIAHVYRDFDNKLDVQEFLDSAIMDIIGEEDPDEVCLRLKNTFDLLEAALGEKALVPYDGDDVRSGARFSLRSLEAIAVGVGKNIYEILSLSNPPEWVAERIKSFWLQPAVEGMSASGMRGTVRLQRTIPFGASWFQPKK